jgi:hypothetical protein
MSGKITHSAKPAPKPKGPGFPIRKEKLVEAANAPPSVLTVNPGRKTAKPHYWGDKEARRFHVAYIAAVVVLTVSLAAGFMGLRQLWLATQISETLCSTVGKSDRISYSSIWLENQPGWDTPKERTELLELCYERSKPF